MEITACIGTAVLNALRLEEIQSQHILELQRLQALANSAFAHPLVDDVAYSKVCAENASLRQRAADQESGTERLRHQARVLTKCASRALELLVRSRGISATTDPEILQLRKDLRKSGVFDAASSDHREDKQGSRTEVASAPVCKKVKGSLITQSDNHAPPSSQVPAHHAKRQRSENPHLKHQISCASGISALISASEAPKSPQEMENSINLGAGIEDDAHATSFPIVLDDSKNDRSCDELFDDVVFNKPVQLMAAHKEAPLELVTLAPAIRPSDASRALASSSLQPAVSHWTAAQPGDRHMKFSAAFATTAAPGGCARVSWDAPNAVSDGAFGTGAGTGQDVVSVKQSLLPQRQVTEPLPPTVEKPQNFIQVVRGGARDKLPGHGCKQCDAFYAALESALPQGQVPTNLCDGSHHAVDARSAVANIRENASRHRAAFRKQDSPEGYWTTKFKD